MPRYVFTQERIAEVKRKCKEFLKNVPYTKDIKVMYFFLTPIQEIKEGDDSADIILYFDDEKISGENEKYRQKRKISSDLRETLGKDLARVIAVDAISVSSLRDQALFEEDRNGIVNTTIFIKGKEFFFKNVTWF